MCDILVMHTTGKELKLERVAADVQAVDLAARMGVSRATLWGWERSARVPADKATRYREALATFQNVATAVGLA